MVAFAAGFDQLARVSLEQYLLWAVSSGGKMSAATFIPQAFLLIRFVVGAVFVGLTRPQFSPVCVAKTSILPIGIAVIAVDVVLVLMLVARAFQVGLVKDIRAGKSDGIRGKAVLFAISGLAVWTGVSYLVRDVCIISNLVYRRACQCF